MNNSSHPSSLLKPKQIEVFREAAPKAEKDGKFGKTQLSQIIEQQWFKLLTPTAAGGMQTSLPDAVQLEEAVAWADGSVGWAVTSCAMGGWYGGFTDAEAVKKVFADSKACIAVASDPTGTAEKSKSGYKISGKWHAAGAGDATAFVANCIVSQGGSAKGLQVVTVLLLKSEVTVSSSWSTMGLAAAAGYSFEAKDLSIPADRVLKADDPRSTGPLYQYPMTQMAEASLAANVSGMTLHFLDLCNELFAQKKNVGGIALNQDNLVLDVLEKSTQRFFDARAKLFYALELSWQSCVNNQPIKPSTLYKVSSSAYDLAKRARECVDALYPFCGLEAADKSSEINRVFRDLHTACQHPLLVFGGGQD